MNAKERIERAEEELKEAKKALVEAKPLFQALSC